MLFEDRFQAGRLLASKLREFANRNDVVVLALPRGGVPVGYEVAQALQRAAGCLRGTKTRNAWAGGAFHGSSCHGRRNCAVQRSHSGTWDSARNN